MKLHLGCGRRYLPTWINIDIRDVKKDLHLDVKEGLPYQSNSIDFIYSEHFIEHLTFEEGNNLFKEIKRVLKSTGIVRTATLDLHTLIDLYLNNIWSNQDWIKNYPDIQSGGSMLNACFYKWHHKYLYDEIDLSEHYLIFKKGYIRCNFGESKYEELQNLETRPESLLILENNNENRCCII